MVARDNESIEPMPDNERAEGEPAAMHPRQHALTMAAAQHLKSAGYIKPGQHRQIVKDARVKLADHKKKKTIAAPFGSLSPTMSSRYMSTRDIQPGPGVVNPPMEE